MRFRPSVFELAPLLMAFFGSFLCGSSPLTGLPFYEVNISPTKDDDRAESASGMIRMTYYDDPDRLASAFCYDRGVTVDYCNEIRAHLHEKKAVMLQEYENMNRLGSSAPIGDMEIFLDNKDMQKILIHSGDYSSIRNIAQAFCGKYLIDSGQCDSLLSHLMRKSGEAELKHIVELVSTIGYHDIRTLGLVESIYSLYEGFQTHYAVLDKVLTAKAAPLVEMIVEKRRKRGDLLRYFLLLAKNGKGEPLGFEPSLYVQTLLSDAAYGEPDRHGNNRVGEGERFAIDRVHASNFSYAEYLRYAHTSTPVIIEGFRDLHGADDAAVPGLPPWSVDRIRNICSNREFLLKKLDRDDTQSWARMKAFKKVVARDYLNAVWMEDLAPGSQKRLLEHLYLHDAPLNTTCPELLHDVVVPNYFSADIMQRVPGSTHRLWKGYRDYWPSIFIGGENTMSALHADWCNSAAWMGLVSGKKRWRIVHPRDRHLLYEDPIRANTFPSDIFEPSDEFETAKYASVYEGVLEAGEVIFIPAAVPHQVLNVGQTISIAMNFVDIGGLDKFLKHAKVSAISTGVTDYTFMSSVVNYIERMDLRRERAMLDAALRNDDDLVDRLQPPTHLDFIAFKSQA